MPPSPQHKIVGVLFLIHDARRARDLPSCHGLIVHRRRLQLLNVGMRPGPQHDITGVLFVNHDARGLIVRHHCLQLVNVSVPHDARDACVLHPGHQRINLLVRQIPQAPITDHPPRHHPRPRPVIIHLGAQPKVLHLTPPRTAQHGMQLARLGLHVPPKRIQVPLTLRPPLHR